LEIGGREKSGSLASVILQTRSQFRIRLLLAIGGLAIRHRSNKSGFQLVKPFCAARIAQMELFVSGGAW
jgi:hypothetical protein